MGEIRPLIIDKSENQNIKPENPDTNPEKINFKKKLKEAGKNLESTEYDKHRKATESNVNHTIHSFWRPTIWWRNLSNMNSNWVKPNFKERIVSNETLSNYMLLQNFVSQNGGLPNPMWWKWQSEEITTMIRNIDYKLWWNLQLSGNYITWMNNKKYNISNWRFEN